MKPNTLAYLLTTAILVQSCLAEFQVNTRSSDRQTVPAVAAGPYGRFTIVWASYFQQQGGRSNDIFARRFDPNAHPLGQEFQVNTTVTGNQTKPEIAADSQGNFVIVWQGPGSDAQDIFARRFDPNGVPLTGEFRVNTQTEADQLHPRIAMNHSGAFVVAWQNEAPGINEYDRAGSLQIFTADGTRLGQEILFSGSLDCRDPDVAIDARGSFVVVWMQEKPRRSIRARLCNPTGTPRAESFVINSIDFSSVTQPSVAMDYHGNFVVTWDGHPKSASQDDIHARPFDPNGIPLSDQFIVNTTSDQSQQDPRISMTSQGQFVIVWYSDTVSTAHAMDVFGQMFSIAGQPIGNEFCPHTYVIEVQRYPAVAMDESGRFIAVWESNEQDGSDYGVFGMIGPSTCPADLTGDCLVNFRDFALLMSDDLIAPAKNLAQICTYWLTSCNP
jgi:hypothetical protein